MRNLFYLLLSTGYRYYVTRVMAYSPIIHSSHHLRKIASKNTQKSIKMTTNNYLASTSLSLSSSSSSLVTSMRSRLPFKMMLLASSMLLPNHHLYRVNAMNTSAPIHRYFSSNTMNISVNSDIGQQSLVERSPNDSRSYLPITLSNGLRVLLISDPFRNQCAAALNVHVGSFSDPLTMPGMAHYCEHMSFLGTRKYPNENEFAQYLSINGGSSNAYTASEDTMYYFDINAAQFQSALDRFAQFFISPLFTEDAAAREVLAIDSEHAKNKNNDAFRLYQLQKQLLANPKHPFRKFATGNKVTLDENPRLLGLSPSAELRKFHDKYYSANLMTLVIYGQQPLETLATWTKEYFEGIPNRGTADPAQEYWGSISPLISQLSSTTTSNMSNESDLNQRRNSSKSPTMIDIQPVKSDRKLRMMWPIWIRSPAHRQQLQLTNPDSLIGHVLGYEGSGSLCSALIQRGWINNLVVLTPHDESDFQSFELSMDLTELGLENRFEIVSAVYAYLHLLKQPDAIPNHIFDEVRALSEIRFRFAEKSDAADYAVNIASEMQRFDDPSLYVIGSRLYGNPRKLARLTPFSNATDLNLDNTWINTCKNAVKDYLEHFTIPNTVIRVIDKQVAEMGISASDVDISLNGISDNVIHRDVEERQVAEYYDTKFRQVHVDSNWVDRWSDAITGRRANNVTDDIAKMLTFPPKNDLIPRNFSLVGEQLKVPDGGSSSLGEKLATSIDRLRLEALNEPPMQLVGLGNSNVWYKLDRSFAQPKAHIILSYSLPLSEYTPEFSVDSKLFFNCFFDDSREYLYDARLAGLVFRAEVTSYGVQFIFSGYTDKMELFVSTVLAKLAQFQPHQPTFERFRENMLRQVISWNVSQPHAQARHYASLATQTMHIPMADMKVAIESSVLANIAPRMHQALTRSHCTGLVIGSITSTGGEEIVRRVEQSIPFTPLAASDRLRPFIAIIPSSEELNRGCIDDKSCLSTMHHTAGQGCSPVVGSIIRHNHTNPSEMNSAVIFQFQCNSRDPNQYLMMELLSEIIEQPFYNTLRTQQQLGYIVSSSLSAADEVFSLVLIVQSAVVSGEEMTARIEGFIEEFVIDQLRNLTTEEFEAFRAGLITRKSEPDHRLTEQASRFWGEIVVGSTPRGPEAVLSTPLFNREQRDISLLSTFTLTSLQEFASSSLGHKSPSRRLLISVVDGAVSQTAMADIHNASILTELQSDSEVCGTNTENKSGDISTSEDPVTIDEGEKTCGRIHDKVQIADSEPVGDGVKRLILNYAPVRSEIAFRSSRPKFD